MTEIMWHNLKAYELNQLAKRDAVVIVPVGSTEQHGPHLPVQVDALLAGEVSRLAAERIALKHPVVVTPTVWCGLAEHHMSFGGTITLELATFHALLRDICRSIARHGFTRILIVNGHGGNVAALDALVSELWRETGVEVASATYWTMPQSAKAFAEILEKQVRVRHACEAETSMLLALKPALVDREAMLAVEAPPEGYSPKDGVQRFKPFSEVTKSGVIGVPAAASAEKGERLLAAAAEAIADAVDRGIWPRPA